ncbi:alpha-(1,3)-fucosyltransferase C [Aplysia californica]|uniref:Fucosyltransferase n=1 Tax=Aplysia californica TaxID=6500 RepID=A0ABM0K875_APLCA|nr:alpha-(1,3)-fucosyltransferase C [Aplysia californica]
MPPTLHTYRLRKKICLKSGIFFIIVLLTFAYLSHSGIASIVLGYLKIWLPEQPRQEMAQTKPAGNFNPVTAPEPNIDTIVGTFPWLGRLNSISSKLIALRELKKMGYEAAESHSFKSPYIITPVVSSKITGLNFHSGGFKSCNPSGKKKKRIACFNCPDWMDDSAMKRNRDFQACPCPSCEYIGGRKEMASADVVLFFVGMLGKERPPPRPTGQIWVMASMESPPYFGYPQNYQPWRDVFNWTLTYRTDSDWFRSYGPLVWRDKDLLLTDDHYLSLARGKTRDVAWFVSHCPVQSRRLEYVRQLQKYINVDIYGKCGNLSCPRSQFHQCQDMLKTYRFYLSFENSFCQDYVSEKLLLLYKQRSHVIPVVRGGFDYDRYLPPDTVINAAHFRSARELGVYLKELGSNPDRYAKVLKEVDKLTGLGHYIDWCDICEKINTVTASKKIPDIKAWSNEGKCHPPKDV